MATDRTMVQGSESNGIAPSILTVRMIMQGKEVGSIIGKKGDNIKKYREDSGAKINISDGSCPERIVTITGTIDNIHKAFTMICSKFEEQPVVFQDLQNTPTVPKPPVTLRLVVPASQCGSLIGKGGIKIKEIRESTGASIQVASEMLPNSTERAVTVSGTAEAVTACIKVVCNIMLESPPKGATIPYRPKPAVPPVMYAGGQAYVIQNPQIPMPPPAELNKLNQMTLGQPVPMLPPTAYLPDKMQSLSDLRPGAIWQYQNLAGPSLSAAPGYAPMPFQQRAIQNGPIPTPNGQQTHEMNIPNDLIGCIIGRGGQKINEIRQISGANIKISNAEDGCPDRKVTITGTPETISMAQYLINTSMELHKTLVLDPNSATATSPSSTVNPPSPASPVSTVASMSSPVVSAPTCHIPMSMPSMPLSMPQLKPVQLMNVNGLGPMGGMGTMSLNGLNGIPTLPHSVQSMPGALNCINGLNSVNGLSNLSGLNLPNLQNMGLVDPLLMAGGIAPMPHSATNFTGKVRVGVATVKTGSPKFAPY